MKCESNFLRKNRIRCDAVCKLAFSIDLLVFHSYPNENGFFLSFSIILPTKNISGKNCAAPISPEKREGALFRVNRRLHSGLKKSDREDLLRTTFNIRRVNVIRSGAVAWVSRRRARHQNTCTNTSAIRAPFSYMRISTAFSVLLLLE